MAEKNPTVVTWENARAILADKSSDPKLRDIAQRIVETCGVTAEEVDLVFKWKPQVVAVEQAVPMEQVPDTSGDDGN
jgi:hypothetical protein